MLERVLRDAGASTAGFAAYAAGPGRAEHDALNAAAFAAGVFGVPTYLAGDEMWFGREHLPRVAWLLSGARGPAPDVANRSFAQPPAPRLRTRCDGARMTVLLDLRRPGVVPRAAARRGAGRGAGPRDRLAAAHRAGAPSRRRLRVPTTIAATLHRRHRAHAIARELAVHARAQGLELREPYRDPDARAFDLGWLWLRERAPQRLYPFLAAGFRAYWSLALDPSSVAAVGDLLRSVGDDASGFAAWCAGEGPATAARVAGEQSARGWFGVPGYVVEGEYFLGRQHLPMIRWILGGRAGPGPI